MTATPQAAAPRHVTAPSLMRATIRTLCLLAPPLAVRTAARLFRYPIRPRSEALPGDRFSLRAGKHVVRGGVRGEGPLVILAHGWAGWEAQFDAIGKALVAKGFRVVTFSQIGHGASSGRFSSMIEFRDGLRAIAAHFGEPHAIVGHSLGAASSAFAVSEGLHTSRLVLIAPSGHPQRYLDLFLDWLEFPDSLRDRVMQHIETLLRFAWQRLDIEAFGPLIQAPTLVIHDRGDREVPWSEGAEAARLIPGAELMSVETLGHRRILRDAKVIERVCNFI